MSVCASDPRPTKCIAFVDIKRAYFYAPTEKRKFDELPQEDTTPGEEGVCGLLLVSLYGARDVAQRWGDEFGYTLKQIVLGRGLSSSRLHQNTV